MTFRPHQTPPPSFARTVIESLINAWAAAKQDLKVIILADLEALADEFGAPDPDADNGVRELDEFLKDPEAYVESQQAEPGSEEDDTPPASRPSPPGGDRNGHRSNNILGTSPRGIASPLSMTGDRYGSGRGVR